jgi:LysM repeat protein
MRGAKSAMNKFALAFIAAFFSTLLFFQIAPAKEDTAQLTFDKTTVSKQNLHTYTVQKGDMISAIVRTLPNVTEKDIPKLYETIKKLNPEIDDLNKLNVGQTIVLPGKVQSAAKEKSSEAATPADGDGETSMAAGQSYRIKKGDSLIHIIHREMRIKSHTQKTLLLVKAINPSIKNINKIYAGQIIKLPAGKDLVKAAPEIKRIPREIIKPQEIIKPAEAEIQPENIIEVKEKIIISPAARLAVIKKVVTDMKGTVITNGNYYLPVSQTDQVTIDCTKIPVIELDNRSTIFLDMENRAPGNLKKMIGSKWINYHLVNVNEKDDIITILKKIFSTDKNYNMTKSEKPMIVGSVPPVEIFLDWVITKYGPDQGQKLLQGLRLVDENNRLLPRAIVNYARNNGLIITEISPQNGLVGQPEEIYSLASMPVFPATPPKEFSFALMTHLGLKSQKDLDIKVFNIAKDGFNLSIKADLVVNRDNKQHIFFSRNLPPQFVNILEKEGNKLYFIGDKDSPKSIMEMILRAFQYTFVSGYFTFNGSDKDHAPYTLSFTGTKIKITGTDKDIYVIDFDIDQGMRGLLREAWSANIARY